MTNDGTNTYSYDAEGRILTADSNSYVYDGMENRVKTTISGAVTLYWPGVAGGIIDESDSTASTMAKQVAFANSLVWRQSAHGGSSVFLFQDHLGSTHVASDGSGTVKDSVSYYPYGGRISYSSVSSDNHYGFTGDQEDPDSDYAVFRNLNTVWGRFNRPDPYNGSYDFSNPQSLNRYSYVANSPVTGTDKLGLQRPPEDDGLGYFYDGNQASAGGGSGFGAGWDEFEALTQITTSYTPWVQNGHGVWGWGETEYFPGGLDLFDYAYIGPSAQSNSPQTPLTCQQQRILNAVPGSTLTDPTDTVGTSIGGHNQFGINVTIAQLTAAGFTPFNPFGHADGYHNGNIFFQVHDNGPGGLVTEGHIDTFNPATGLFGFIGHSIWDFGIGTLLQHLFPHSHGLLDPKCPS